MSPGFVSSRTALLRGLGAMLGAAALAAGAIRMSAERWAGAGAAELEPWASAGLCGALVATLGAALAWPVLRRAERLSDDHRRTAEELERHRSVDPATGLPNRRAFEELLARSLAVGHRHGYRVGLLLIHLGGWHRSSLRLGSEDADGIMREITTLTARNLRAADGIARIGSEDLAIVIGKVESREDLVTLAERLVARVEKVAARHAGVELSCSIGIAVGAAEDGSDAASGRHALIRCAGEALAEAESGADAPWRLHAVPDHPGSGRLSVVR